ncbi:MAG: response regulator transcription factor [Acidimicrobiales bacterium]
MKAQSVVVVDDHALLAEVMAAALRAEGYGVTVLEPSHDLVADITSHHPDCVLLDLELGDDSPSGIEVAEGLAEHDVRTVMLTGVSDPARLGRALRAGAAGVVPKTVDFETLMNEVQAALDGGALSPPRNERARLLASAAQPSPDDGARQLAALLSHREAVVLDGLVQGLSPQQIADQSFVAVSTVRSQIKSLRAKMGAESALQAVARAVELGWQPGSTTGIAS